MLIVAGDGIVGHKMYQVLDAFSFLNAIIVSVDKKHRRFCTEPDSIKEEITHGLLTAPMDSPSH